MKHTCPRKATQVVRSQTRGLFKQESVFFLSFFLLSFFLSFFFFFSFFFFLIFSFFNFFFSRNISFDKRTSSVAEKNQ